MFFLFISVEGPLVEFRPPVPLIVVKPLLNTIQLPIELFNSQSLRWLINETKVHVGKTRPKYAGIGATLSDPCSHLAGCGNHALLIVKKKKPGVIYKIHV